MKQDTEKLSLVIEHLLEEVELRVDIINKEIEVHKKYAREHETIGKLANIAYVLDTEFNPEVDKHKTTSYLYALEKTINYPITRGKDIHTTHNIIQEFSQRIQESTRSKILGLEYDLDEASHTVTALYDIKYFIDEKLERGE